MNKKYAGKIVHSLVATSYFITATCWGYYVLKDTKWLPWWMGGPEDGGWDQMQHNPPFDPVPFPVYEYSLYTFGFHFEGFFDGFLHREENDFLEMLLHHIAACALYFGYTYGSFY